MSESRRRRAASRLRAIENRLVPRALSPEAAAVVGRPTVAWDLDRLAGCSFCLLVTFRRDGRPVPTPMWFGRTGERLSVRCAASDGKLKRVRHTPGVLVAPCDVRGRPLGPAMPGHGRILSPAEAVDAEAALRRDLGWQRRLYDLTRARLLDAAYLELSATPPDGRDARASRDCAHVSPGGRGRSTT